MNHLNNPAVRSRLGSTIQAADFDEGGEDIIARSQSARNVHVKAKRGESALNQNENNSIWRRLVLSPRFETFGGIVVLFNFFIMTVDTHARAMQDENTTQLVVHANRLLLVYYTCELALRIHVFRRHFLRSSWNILDLVIVSTGLASEALEVMAVSGSALDQIAMLKSLRMLRLLRLLRLLVAFRELYVLVAGVSRCMKTLFWASGLIFIMTNVWSILSVEYLDDCIDQLAATGQWASCDWCRDAFSNIWLANMTWFQIISGDGWSVLGRPLAEEFVWPYALFVLNIFIVVWGLLNLIVAAIVESSMAAREDDINSTAKMMAAEQASALSSFQRICKDMDADGSGTITIDEFKEFWKESKELQNHLVIMGVTEKDMDGLMAIMDKDGSGSLDYDEFIEQFTQMRSLVVKTIVYYTLRHIEKMNETLNAVASKVLGSKQDPADNTDACSNGGSRTQRAMLPEPYPQEDCRCVRPGWYYFGDRPPMDMATFWHHVGPLASAASPSIPPSPRAALGQAMDDKARSAAPSSKRSSIETRSSDKTLHAFPVDTLGPDWQPAPLRADAVATAWTSKLPMPPPPDTNLLDRLWAELRKQSHAVGASEVDGSQRQGALQALPLTSALGQFPPPQGALGESVGCAAPQSYTVPVAMVPHLSFGSTSAVPPNSLPPTPAPLLFTTRLDQPPSPPDSPRAAVQIPLPRWAT